MEMNFSGLYIHVTLPTLHLAGLGMCIHGWKMRRRGAAMTGRTMELDQRILLVLAHRKVSAADLAKQLDTSGHIR